MNKKILQRPMFQQAQRQHYGAGSSVKKTYDFLTKKPIAQLKKFNEWDKGLSPLPDGSIPIIKKPRRFPMNAIIPNRKSLKGVYLGGVGFSGYDLLAPETVEKPVERERIVTADNNIISRDVVVDKANSLTDKMKSITKNAVTSITGGDNEKINNGTEVFEGANTLSANIFATKNDEVVVAKNNLDNQVNNRMNMDTKFSTLDNGAQNFAEQLDITKIDMTRVNAIKEQLGELVGDPTNSNNMNMLMQLGASLMSGKTLKGGLAGFFDVAGQAGLQILPQMLAISDRSNARDQELALAAFELVQEANNKDDNFGPGKGTMVYPHQIQYKMENGEYVKDEGGNFIPTGYTPVGSGFGFSKDYQSQGMMNANSVLTSQGQPPLYTLLDAATTGASGAFGANDVVYATEGNSDAAIKYATVLERGLPRIADMLSFITTYNGDSGTFNSDLRTGPLGKLSESARKFMAPWKQIAHIAPFMGNTKEEVMGNWAKNYQEAFNMVDQYWMNQMESDNGRLVDVEDISKLNPADGTFTDVQGLYAGQTYTFLDEGNNLQTAQTQAGDVYETPLSLKMKIGAKGSPWNDANVGLMEQYKNQIGMVVARYKQPTGRLLADTIKDSKDDIDLTSYNIPPNDIVNKQFTYFKNFLTDWNKQMRGANKEVTAEMIDERFGAADGSGGGLSKINNALMSYNMWADIKEAQSPGIVVRPMGSTWIKLPGLIYPGAEKPGGGVYNTNDIRDFFREGIQGGNLGGVNEPYYGSDLDEVDMETYIDDYFEAFK